MGTSVLDSRYTVNGLIDTSQQVLQNLQTLCNTCGTWLTYDIHNGRWAFVINKAGTSQWTFTDKNIIGAINISGTGLDNLYSGARISFPNEDLQNKNDWVQIDIPVNEWFPNESVNVMQISYPLVVDPIQAQLLGFIELKQSRVDKIIRFTTDYSMLGVAAGDLIDVTNSIYGFTNKMFRVITVSERDDDDNAILLDITALEYDADVYDTSNLERYVVTNQNGILPKGAIPAPINFTVTKYETDARPRVDFSATVTSGGLVEGVEFWVTKDVSVPVDADREYTLIGTSLPVSGKTFPAGTTVTYSADYLSSGNFLAKARNMNSDGVSPFTDLTGFVYTPVQVTQGINNNTTITESGGLGGLGGMLGMGALLSLLNALFSGFGGSGTGSSAISSALSNLWSWLKGEGHATDIYIQVTDPADEYDVVEDDIWYEVEE